MNKTKIIIKREYLSRVRKKSFVVMTILGPLMICALLVVPVLLQQTGESRSEIIVVDATAERLDDKSVAIFKNKFKSDDAVHYTYSDDIEAAQKILKDNSCDAVLEIVSTSDNPPIKSFLYYGENEPGLKVQEQTKNQILNILRNSILQYDYGMNEKQIEWINNPTIDFYTKNILTGESSFNEIKTILGAVGGFLIYMFIFIFGSMVMKGVSEEKTNRIVEVLVSSVKPVQLLMGKLIAIALVGLTQFAMWVVLTVGIISFVQAASPELFAPAEQEQITVNERVITVDKLNSVESSEANELVQGLMAINYPLVIGMFLFFFIAGFKSFSDSIDNFSPIKFNGLTVSFFYLHNVNLIILCVFLEETTIYCIISFWYYNITWPRIHIFLLKLEIHKYSQMNALTMIRANYNTH